jgi:hypothetical protein
MLNTIVPANGFKDELKDLLANCPFVQEKEMGFPEKWRNEPFWK